MNEKLTAEKKKQLIAEHMREILSILGLDPTHPSLVETPHRIAHMYVDEIFSGLDPRTFPELAFQEENVADELILVKNISFVSFCEHHFVPISGKVHVAYLPKKRIIGLGNIPKLIHYFAKRPQVQERLTREIAEALSSILETDDVAVAIQASHFCIMARGVEEMGAHMETHLLKGCFEKKPSMRTEFFSRLPV